MRAVVGTDTCSGIRMTAKELIIDQWSSAFFAMRAIFPFGRMIAARCLATMHGYNLVSIFVIH